MSEVLEEISGYTPPKYYIDITTNQQLIGDAAYELHLEAGGHPADIREVASFIYSDEPIPNPIHNNPDFTSLSVAAAVERGRWLYNVLEQSDIERPGGVSKRVINDRAIGRAAAMGLHASIKQLEQAEKPLRPTDLYKLIGNISAYRHFDGLTTTRAIEYLREMSERLGRMVTVEDIEKAAADSLYLPAFRQTLARIIPGGLSRVAEELGYYPRSGNPRSWAASYMIVNNSQRPSPDIMGVYALQKKGPTKQSLLRPGETVEAAFNEIQVLMEQEKDKLFDPTKNKPIPRNIYDASLSEAQLISRALRFDMITQLLPTLSSEQISRIVLDDLPEGQLIRSLRKYSLSINWLVMKELSLEYGVLQDMWRSSFLERLDTGKVLRKHLENARGQLSEEESFVFEDKIDLAIDYLIATNGRMLKTRSIEMLQQAGYLPGKREFEKLYVNAKMFRMLVSNDQKDRLSARIQEIEDEDKAIDEFLAETVLPKELFIVFSSGVDNDEAAEILRAKLPIAPENPLADQDETENDSYKYIPLDDESRKKRIARYMLIDKLMPGLPIAEKLVLVVLERSRSFQREIANRDASLHLGDIEIVAGELKIARLIYPGTNMHFTRLAQIQKANKRRINLETKHRAKNKKTELLN